MTIGELKDFSTIFMEDKYKPLRAKGTHPATGYSDSKNMYITKFNISDRDRYNFSGYSFSMKSYISTSLEPLSTLYIEVVKLC